MSWSRSRLVEGARRAANSVSALGLGVGVAFLPLFGAAPPAAAADCWTESATTVSGTVYTVLTFTSTSACAWTVPPGVTSVSAVAVGGGGGGGGGVNATSTSLGQGGGGGGGGGQLSTGTLTVAEGQAVTVTVGAGGAGGSAGGASDGTPGMTGAGTTIAGPGATVSAAGGSGGGAGKRSSFGDGSLDYSGAGGASGGGSAGGSQDWDAGGGGGGAGSSGGNASDPNAGFAGGDGGGGGAGASTSITGTAQILGGGGGGGGHTKEYCVLFVCNTEGNGGTGANGGGNGSKRPSTVAADGTANTGGGGGGGGYLGGGPSTSGGSGADGVAYLRYQSVLVPEFGTVTRTADGFTAPITNYDAAFTWSVSGVTGTVSGAGLLTVTGEAPGATATATVQASRTGYANGSAQKTGQALEAARNPTFGSVSRRSGGFSVPITNFDAAFAWTVTGATGSVSGSGVLTVTGLSQGESTNVTVGTTRSGYVNGTAQVTGQALSPGRTPSFGDVDRTPDGFTVQIENFNGAFLWTADRKGATVSSTGRLEVTGLDPGEYATVRVTASQEGYESEAASTSGQALLAARIPSFGAPVGRELGFEVPILNYDSAFSWSTDLADARVRADGILEVGGLEPGEQLRVLLRTSREGYAPGSAAVLGAALPAVTPSASERPSPRPSSGQTPTPSASPSLSESATPSPSMSASTTASPSPTALPSGSPSAVPSPGASPGVTPSAGPSLSPGTTPADLQIATNTVAGAPVVDTPFGAMSTVNIFTSNGPAGPQMNVTTTLQVGQQATGRSITVNAFGMQPGTTVEVVLFSEPMVLATAPADEQGNAAITATVPANLPAGNHTIMARGTGINGEPVQSIGAMQIDTGDQVTALAPPAQVATPMEPGDPQLMRAMVLGRPMYDPALYPAATAALAVGGAAVLGVVGVGGLASGSHGSVSTRGGSQSGQRDHASLEETRAESRLTLTREDAVGVGDRSRIWAIPGTAVVDAWLGRFAVVTSKTTVLMPRLITDGSWSRAMFGAAGLLLWAAGVVLGLVAAASVQFAPLAPALPLILAIIVLGMLDSMAATIAWAVAFVGAVVTGHLTTWDDLRFFLGLFVLYASLPLIANALRPLRRAHLGTAKLRFDRLADYVMMPILLAFTAITIFKALNGLSGLALTSPEEYGEVAVVALLATYLRLGLEDVVTQLFPARVRAVHPPELSKPSVPMQIVSILLRLGLFVLVALPFFGFGSAVILSTAILAVILFIGFVPNLPSSAFIKKWLPAGFFKMLVMIVIGTYLAAFLLGDDSSGEQIRKWFPVLLLPVLIYVLLATFAGSYTWPDSWTKRVLGALPWVLVAGIVTGVISLL